MKYISVESLFLLLLFILIQLSNSVDFDNIDIVGNLETKNNLKIKPGSSGSRQGFQGKMPEGVKFHKRHSGGKRVGNVN
jgi:hypothetical protein